MEIGDSYFNSSSSEEDLEQEKNLSPAKVVYTPKTCEQNWFLHVDVPGPATDATESVETSIHTIEFTVLKHKADLFYYQRLYQEAAELYERVLALVPASNVCVSREIRDALARCHLRLGQGEPAKTEAAKLILPPHEKDWSAWMLLGKCQESLKHHEAQVIALQTSASLQRCHSEFWIALADAYAKLRTPRDSSINNCTEPHTKTCRSMCCLTRVMSTDDIATVLTNTTRLFKPYFSWRSRPDTDTTQLSGNSSENAARTEKALEEVTAQLSSPMFSPSDCCSNLCLFRELSVQDTSLYQSCILKGEQGRYQQEPTLLPRLSIPVCFHHSPFVMLVRQLLSPVGFVQLLTEDSFGTDSVKVSDSVCVKYHFWQLLDSVYDMAECSCLVWARRILLYSVRHSQSFPRAALESRLQDVEARLSDCHTYTRQYITSHFTQRTVFDEQDDSKK